jgi:hypothetical protein
LRSIRYRDPELTPDNWCRVQPCMTIRLGSRAIRITQPSSTILVYLLGILTTGVGLLFLVDLAGQSARFWWGISLVLWGVGALLAGTSYQAFGYQIKCAGQAVCSWTSWWEVIYLILQQWSMAAMLVAVGYSCTAGFGQTILLSFAALSALIYCIVTLAGALMPRQSLITFEAMVAACSPFFVILVILNGWRYVQFAAQIDAVLLGVWVGLLVTMLAYWLYDRLKLTEHLWAGGKGVWFSQNDVLHIGLIIWVIYIAAVVVPQIRDYPVPL